MEMFRDSHAAAPDEIVRDVTDDALHGQQRGRFFHGYFDCYCHLPRHVTCGPHVLSGRLLRRSNLDAADGPLRIWSGSWGRSGSAGRGCGWWYAGTRAYAARS